MEDYSDKKTILIVDDETTIVDMLVAFGVMFIIKLLGDFIFKRESLGDGDIKLMLVFGIILSPKCLPSTSMHSYAKSNKYSLKSFKIETSFNCSCVIL